MELFLEFIDLSHISGIFIAFIVGIVYSNIKLHIITNKINDDLILIKKYLELKNTNME